MKQTIITILLALFIAPICMEAKKKVKKVEIPQLMNYPSAELGEYRLHGGEVFIKGRVVAQDPQIIKKFEGRISAIMRDYIVEKEKTKLFEINDDGTFSMNLEVPYPMFVLVYPMAEVYACPGDTVDVTIDTTKPNREEGVILSGTGVSGEVSKLIGTIRKNYCEYPERERVGLKGPDSLMIWRDKQVTLLDDMVRKMNAGLPELEGCSPFASDILHTYIIAEWMQNVCGNYQFMDKDSIDRDAYRTKYFDFVAPREKYLTDNPLLMIAGNDFFFNRLEYSLMEMINRYGMSGILFRPDYKPSVAESLVENKSISARDYRMKAMDELHEQLGLSSTDFSAQVCMLRSLFVTMKWHKDAFDYVAEDVASTLPVITHPELIRRALLTYREYVKEKEAKVVEDKPLTKGDSIFQRIIEPYKGNVLYVDFWEMSCGPCRATMLHMRDEVEANKDKPVKYLYITDDTPEQCSSFLEPNKIQGEHIYISRTEWGYLKEKFQFTGIPFVVIFDKDGNRREDVNIQQLLDEMNNK